MKLSGSICALILIACTSITLAHDADSDGVKGAIEAANAQFAAVVAKGDAAALKSLYSPDGQVMPAGSDPI
jgi:ketosteroid isomerase-like protein